MERVFFDNMGRNNESLRLAYFSPLPPARSGIADYSAELLPYLAQHADLTLFVDPPQSLSLSVAHLPLATRHSPLATRHSPLATLPLYSPADYPTMRWNFDVALYHMGNSDHHQGIYEMLTRYPGVVVLHDVFIHQFLAHKTVGQGNYAGYSREMGFARGVEGVHMANAIRAGYGSHPLFEMPLNERLIRSSLGLLVHSHYAAELIEAQRPRCPVEVIPAPIMAHGGRRSSERPRREALGLAAETVIFASIGQVTQNKQAVQLLRVFQQLYYENNHVFLLFVGEVLPEVDLTGMVHDLGLEGAVGNIGYVETLEAFVDWIYTADVIINLRYPTVGETSASALRGLAAGRPLIVFDHGWYNELPNTIALKVPAMDDVALLNGLRSLVASPEIRRQMGQAAAVYARQTHHPAQVAERTINFIRRLIAQWQQPYA